MPRIWGYEDVKWVFWSGVTNSMVERNLAQGISLLSDFNWDPNSYETTVSVRKLEAISKLARKIAPPAWPSAFGAPDLTKAARGKLLFEDRCKCVGCHSPTNDDKGRGASVLNYLDVGTDSSYVEAQRQPLAGRSLFPLLADWLSSVKKSAYLREGLTGMEQASFEQGRTPAEWRAPAGLEARPLHGIWAAAPYLHNGSIPSIRQLLTAPPDRVRSFYVGSTEYDPNDLGFSNQAVLYPGYEGAALRDTSLPGNGNGGHDFCTDLPDADKDALIEFLKTY
jgi:hypothetical protein